MELNQHTDSEWASQRHMLKHVFTTSVFRLGLLLLAAALLAWPAPAQANLPLPGADSHDGRHDRVAHQAPDAGAACRLTPFAFTEVLVVQQVKLIVNSNAFGFNTTLMDYDDRLEGAGTGQTLTYTAGFSRERLSLQQDGTYRADRTPMLAGMIARRNQDGSSTLRDKNGTVRMFGSDGWIRSITDRNGNTVTIVRSGNQIQQIIEPGGRALTFQYSGGGISQIIDPLGRTVTYAYENEPTKWGNARLKTVTNPAGGVTTYGYAVAFNLSTITDARGITYLTNIYCSGTNTCPLDPAVVTQTMADGGVSQIDYVVTNQTVTQATVTDPRVKKTIHRFNTRSHEVGGLDALGQQTRMTRDFTSNQVMEVRDPLNRLTKFTYDPAGNVNSVLDPQQNPTIFEYETNFNRVTRITDANNQNTRFTYDPTTGNLLTTIDPLTHATAIAYNQFGQPISVTDALGNVTQFEYDEVGNLIATTDPVGNRTLRFYDAVSRLVAIVDARGKSTQFTYDTLNRVTQIQDAINGVTSFTYDPNGNLLTVTDAKNQVTTYTYDNMDRLATRTDALNRTETYAYDVAGNLTAFTDRKNQVTTFQYDALNRRIRAEYADGSVTTFTYDAAGRLVKASDTAPGAGTIDFAYDILDRLIQETTPQGTVAYQYDVLGRRTQMVANGQQPTIYQYDPALRLTQVAQGSLFASLGYDNANRRTSLGYSNGTTTSYAYDLASRLTNITHNGPSGIIEALTYTYDMAGNRLSANRANGTASLLPNPVASAAYDAANEQTQFGGATLAYDNNGNLTSDGVNTYQWDARNRLIGVTGGSTASFAYDPLGRRASKTINGTSMQFAYDGNDITAEIGGGAVGASYLRSLNIDEMFGFLRQDGAYFSIYDGLGSTLALTNETGTPAVQYSYDPFGKTQSSDPTFANPFQFTGRENENTGLYYYRARYYMPTSHRFVSEDPLGIGGGDTNYYAYTSNSPVNRIDPLGLLYVDVGGNLPLVWPGEFGPVVNGGIQVDDNGSVFLYGGWGLGVGPSASIVFFPGNPEPGLATKISSSYQLLPAIPTPLGTIPPLGIKGVMAFDPQGAASVKVGGGINIGSSLAFIPQNASKCVLRCNAGKVKSKTNQ